MEEKMELRVLMPVKNKNFLFAFASVNSIQVRLIVWHR